MIAQVELQFCNFLWDVFRVYSRINYLIIPDKENFVHFLLFIVDIKQENDI